MTAANRDEPSAHEFALIQLEPNSMRGKLRIARSKKVRVSSLPRYAR